MQDKFSFANRDFSFWELDALASRYDFVVVGAGLVGLSTSLSLKDKYPDSEILILERSSIPYGASTRNAGFACFGSVTEILDDIETMSIDKVSALISNRWKGLRLLRDRVGDQFLKYQNLGGYEIFRHNEESHFDRSHSRLNDINQLIQQSTGLEECFTVKPNGFGFNSYESILYNQYEGQLHPGLMMDRLTDLVLQSGIRILYGANVTKYETDGRLVTLSIDNTQKPDIKAPHAFFTTNAFISQIIPTIDVKPSRNQVLVTKPIKNLRIKGCFHYDKGFVYFRNYQDRLLIGGGRNLALDEESTDEFGLTDKIQHYLRTLVSEVILPNTMIEEEIWWSGIIATGGNKEPIVQSIESNVHLGVKLSGMGVALGSLIGQKLSDLV